MAAEVIKVESPAAIEDAASRAASALAAGRLVVFPTETVYGLGVNASDAAGIRRLREVKGRASTQPFTVHIGRPGDWEQFVPETSPVARRLVQKGWPGPITLIFAVPDPARTPVFSRLPPEGVEAVFHDHSVGLRCPDDDVASRLLGAAGVPVIASSANRAGRPPPLTAQDALADLDDEVDLVIDAGRTRYGKPSTIVTVNGDRFSIVRAGVFDDRTIRRIANFTLLFVCTGNTCRSPMAEGLARKLLAERLGTEPKHLTDRGIIICSAGTGSSAGGRAAPEAVEVMGALGVDISGHRTAPLSLEAVQSADRIYAMARSHEAAVLALSPSARERLALLDPSGDVADPVGGTHEDYEQCAAHIAAALRNRLNEVPI